MKRIDQMKHLEPFGIIPLTGEACRHNHRILCDLTAKGKGIIERALDIQITPAESWNSDKNEPHIGSFMLPYEFVSTLAIYALLSDPDIVEVWLYKDQTVVGFSVEDVDAKERMQARSNGTLRKIFYAQPSDRHVHAFTGRAR